jgi:alpha-amylase
MTKFKLAFGIHNHQPVGNFEAVFEEAHTRAYAPFLEMLERYPDIRLSLHQSGILWRWQQARHPEYFEQVGSLVDTGRVELMTGGFYEPILSAVPERDAAGQIAMLSDYIKQHFEVQPKGLWLTERIWEPHLPKLLAHSGVKYLPIDDTHFVYAGFDRSELTGPFITENEGEQVILLPIQKRLRYLIPFGTIDEVIDNLRTQAERNPGGMAVYADDGEKFGIWPDTYKHCYDDRWLDHFFTAISANSDWLEVVPLDEATTARPVGRAYLPTASYEEMLHWALPPAAFSEYEKFEKWLKDSGQWERYGRFVRGGHWRGFLSKYEEANLLHKKMLRVSRRLAEQERQSERTDDRVDYVRDRLYASQCNCPYWHGVFGGLYLPHIRQAVYEAMIEADHALNKLQGATGVSSEIRDFDSDGHDEVIISNDLLAAMFRPGSGGMLLDLSLDEQGFNLTDTLSRRREGYHAKLEAASDDTGGATKSIHDIVVAKEEGLSDVLVEDWYLKRCFIDHFIAPGVTLEEFARADFDEEGDFVLEPYGYSLSENSQVLEMSREGRVWRDNAAHAVRVIKQFSFDPGSGRIAAAYQLNNLSGGVLDLQFAVENNFTFQAGHAEDRSVLIDNSRPQLPYLDAAVEHKDARSVVLVDEYRSLAVALTSDRPATLWRAPIFTVSLSEGGFEKVYQGTTLVHLFPVQLASEPMTIRFQLLAGVRDDVMDAFPPVSEVRP